MLKKEDNPGYQSGFLTCRSYGANRICLFYFLLTFRPYGSFKINQSYHVNMLIAK